MKYQGIIFDLDGVICHTDKYHYQAWKVIADRLGIPFNETINNRLRGVSRLESLTIILEQYDKSISDDQKLQLAEEKNKIYRGLLTNLTTDDLDESVTKTLNTLRNCGIKLAIGSSSKNARYILGRIGLGSYFDAISDGSNITYTKPHPEVFLIAASRLDLSPASCLVVEDAMAGVDAAHAGGMHCAAIGDATISGKSEYILDCISDLLTIAL